MQATNFEQRFLKLAPEFTGRLVYAQEMPSTSDHAQELIARGAESGTLIVAEAQTAGRGRRGNAWRCPAGEGLLFSLILEPEVEKCYWSRFSLAVGLAVAEAIEAQGLQAQIKWPNDVWINGKKCGGILVETFGDFAVVGIGVNVLVEDFPEEVESIATSLKRESGREPVREELLRDIVRGVMRWTSCCGDAFPHVLERVRSRCVLSGQKVSLTHAAERLTGEVLGIGDDGSLLFLENGKLRPLQQADEVRLACGEESRDYDS